MRIIVLMLAAAIVGCASVDAAMVYAGEKPQKIPASIPLMSIDELDVYRSAKKPGMVWVAPKSSRLIVLAYSYRDSQWTALLPTMIEPAYRAAAIEALGPSCTLANPTPWPDQFAIEFAYECPQPGDAHGR